MVSKAERFTQGDLSGAARAVDRRNERTKDDDPTEVRASHTTKSQAKVWHNQRGRSREGREGDAGQRRDKAARTAFRNSRRGLGQNQAHRRRIGRGPIYVGPDRGAEAEEQGEDSRVRNNRGGLQAAEQRVYECGKKQRSPWARSTVNRRGAEASV